MEYRQLRAPRGHGEIFADPPLQFVAEMVAENVELFQQRREIFSRVPFFEWATAARREVYTLARRYTSQYMPLETLPEMPPRFFLAGHQPQLFHPGVWLKNFALDKFAAAHDAVGINLLVDNDLLNSTSLRTPGGSRQNPLSQSVVFDSMGAAIPFEERKIIDRATFSSFAERVEQQMAPWVKDPLIRDFWPLVLKASESSENLGQCFAQARHLLERRWGSRTLEVPLSQVCETESFHQFTAHLLLLLPLFREIYNTSLAEYRAVNRIRSRSHPVPDLVEENQWLEAPFWIWDSTDSRRRRLFVFHREGELLLTDRGKIEISLSTSVAGDLGKIATQLRQLAHEGVKLRPRALITTMYARLVLSDLFIHGIGGAKYDQLTDVLIRRFFRVEPPGFLALSATALLPIDRKTVVEDDLRRIDQYLRELRFHPEEHLGQDCPAEAVKLAKKKRSWIARSLSRGEGRQRHQEITRANDALQEFVAVKRKKLLAQRAQVARDLQHETILASREYSFCLFPESTLRDWLLDFMAQVP